MSFLSKLFNLDECTTLPDGRKEWRNSDGKLNRGNDEPAIIGADGTKIWYRNGARHRVGGPAVMHADGSDEWWIYGKRLQGKELGIAEDVSRLVR